VLGEDQELHPRVIEHAFGRDDLLELDQLALDLALFEQAGLVDQPRQLEDLFPK
jgi:hypothetical protein